MRILAIVAGLALAACAQQQAAGPNYGEVEEQCGAGGKPFIQTWPCLRVGATGLPMYPDIKAVFIATGDYIVTQVQEGRMTDAEAKLAMAQARQKGYDAIDARNARSRQSDAAADAFALEILTRNRQQTQPPPYYTAPPAFISTPRGTVTCQRTGPNSVYCG